MNILSYECEMAKCHDQLQEARAEIIRLKTELEDRCLEIRTLKVDLEQWKSGFEKMAESDRLETEGRVHWEERAGKADRELAKLTAYIDQEKFNWRLDRERANGAEAEIAELRDAVTRYFTYKDRSEKLWIKQKQTRLTTNESYFTAKKKTEAEQQLRSLVRG